MDKVKFLIITGFIISIISIVIMVTQMGWLATLGVFLFGWSLNIGNKITELTK